MTSVFCSNQLCGVVAKDLSSHKAWCRGQARGQCHRPSCRLLHVTTLLSGTESVAITWVMPRGRHCSQHCVHGLTKAQKALTILLFTHSDFTHHGGHKEKDMDENVGYQSLRDHILSYHTTPSEADKPESPKNVACLGCAMLHTAKQLGFPGLRSAFL